MTYIISFYFFVSILYLFKFFGKQTDFDSILRSIGMVFSGQKMKSPPYFIFGCIGRYTQEGIIPLHFSIDILLLCTTRVFLFGKNGACPPTLTGEKGQKIG